jgi:ubiquitin-like protein Pup
MAEQERRRSTSGRQSEEPAVHDGETSTGDGEISERIDDLLEEIDSVLEENAEEFVKNYVQKGGE